MTTLTPISAEHSKLRRTARPVSLRAPLGDHIRKHAGKHADDAVLVRALSQHERLVKAWDAVADMSEHRHPEMTETGHRRKLAQAADEALKRLASANDDVSRDLNLRLEKLKAEISQRIALKESATAPEIRSILREMSNADRGAAIRAGIEAEDVELLSAVFTGHPLSVGMSRQQMIEYRGLAEKQLAGDLTDLRTALEKTQKLLQESFIDSVMLAESIEGPKSERAKVEEAYAKSAAAAAALQAVIG